MNEPKNRGNHPWRLTLLAGLLAAQFAVAQPTTPLAIDIPAQPLAAALARFAEQSGLKLLYAAELVAGKAAPGLQGQYTTADALRRLLAGTGLRARAIEDGAISIEAAPPAADGTTTLRPVRVGASGLGDPAATGYAQPVATSATKTATPLMETPMSVQVIPQQVLQDQRVTQLDDALANVSGVLSSAGKRGGLAETIWLRGFETSDYFRDGVAVANPNGGFGLATLANVESVEVLKGPAAILYGRMEPGGLVNLVTKKPLDTPYRSFSQTLGAYSLSTSTLDATGPIDADKAWLYRLIVSHDQGGVQRNDVARRKTFVAPSLTFRAGRDDDIDLAIEVTKDKASFTNTNSIYDSATGQILWLPRTNNLAPYDASIDTLQTSLGWTHRFGPDWTLKARLQHTKGDSDGEGLQFGGFSFDNATSTWLLSRAFQRTTDRTTTDAASLDLTGRFSTGAVKHTLLAGADFRRVKDDVLIDYNFAVADTDAFNPVRPTGLAPSGDSWIRLPGTDTVSGFYLQDQLQLPQDVFAVAGLRYQRAKLTSGSEYGPDFGGGGLVADEDRSDHAVTPRLGLLWRAQANLSLYGSFTSGFGVNNGRDWEHNPLPPEKARQIEVGVKTEWMGGKLSSTVALFNLTKTNKAVGDPLHPGFNITIGEIRSRGLEFDLQGEAAPGWNVLASYSYTDAVVTKSSAGNYFVEGNRMFNVPRHLLRLATTYSLGAMGLPGWKLGGGLRHVGSTLDNTNTYVNPAYNLLDAMASYDFSALGHKATLQLNVKNLTNKFYYSSSFIASYANAIVADEGQPRTVAATLKVEF